MTGKFWFEQTSHPVKMISSKSTLKHCHINSENEKLIEKTVIEKLQLRPLKNVCIMAITGILDKHTESDDASTLVPYSTKWISEDLLLETRKVWSKAYNRVLSNEEAIEILMNVKRMAEVLIEMQRE